jgi:hypothetical protein
MLPDVHPDLICYEILSVGFLIDAASAIVNCEPIRRRFACHRRRGDPAQTKFSWRPVLIPQGKLS